MLPDTAAGFSARGKSLLRAEDPVGLSPYEFEVLHLLVRRPNIRLSRDVLIRAGWQDAAVGDNSLEKRVRRLRRHPCADDLERYIRTVSRQGYQCAAPVTAVEGETAATDLELLAPHRATEAAWRSNPCSANAWPRRAPRSSSSFSNIPGTRRIGLDGPTPA
ncbi:MAG: winged helix-turn-helix transcriptional regulator [Acidobacteria bacterium]|nr:winged helix-turn-helix transcriptional regulator [Acidobacteriota bacterium]